MENITAERPDTENACEEEFQIPDLKAAAIIFCAYGRENNLTPNQLLSIFEKGIVEKWREGETRKMLLANTPQSSS
jgi:hypothetical protein